MRTVRSLLIGALSLALLSSMSIVVLAQTEEPTEEPAVSPVVVSGTLECLDSSEASTDDPDAIEGSVVTVHAWQASDARLAGEVSYTGRWQLYEEPSEDTGDVDVTGDSAVYEIVNEGGRWLCEAARTAAPRTADDTHTLVFSGEDGYEGLTAYLHVDWASTPYAFTGLILAGEAPPYAPPAE